MTTTRLSFAPILIAMLLITTRSVSAQNQDLKGYTECNVGPEFQIAQVDGPVKDFSWQAQTKGGEVSIAVETGYRVMVSYLGTELFGNLKVERLPQSRYIDEKANLLSNLEFLAAQPGMVPKVQTDTLNGSVLYGIDRNVLEGGVLSTYVWFRDKESVVVTMYLLNAKPAERRFSTLTQYQAIRDQFLDAYTKCLAPVSKPQ